MICESVLKLADHKQTEPTEWISHYPVRYQRTRHITRNEIDPHDKKKGYLESLFGGPCKAKQSFLKFT